MKRWTGLFLLSWLAAAGCTNAPGDVDPGLATAAITVDCSDEDAYFLATHTFYAARAIEDAHRSYRFEPLAQHLFGPDHSSVQVEAMLRAMTYVARNESLTYQCEAEESLECENGALLWVRSTAPSTRDYTIHVCGRRLWENLDGSERDGGNKISRLGAIVHEIAHLAGAWADGTGEQFVLDSREADPWVAPFLADAYRLYVMN